MLRFLPALVVGLTLAAEAAPVQAQWFSEFFATIPRDFKRNNCWPDPFVQMDRESVRLPFQAMVVNGWRKQNLLSEHHFEEDTARLTQAGEIKVYWILSQVPPQHRTIFVQRAQNGDITTARVDAVQQTALRYVPAGELPEVVETNLPTDGRPAEVVDSINRAFNKNAKLPILPASSGGDTSSSGGAGN